METNVGEAQGGDWQRRQWMVRARTLTSALAVPPAVTLPPVRRRLRRLAALAFAPIALLALAGAVWLMAQTYLLGWQTGDWDRALFAVFVYMESLYLAGTARVALIKTRRAATRPRRPAPLLDAIASGDPHAAVLAEPQPTFVPPADLPTSRVAFSSLRLSDGAAQARRAPSLPPGSHLLPLLAAIALPRALGAEDIGLLLLVAFFASLSLLSLNYLIRYVARVRRVRAGRTGVEALDMALLAADAGGLLWRPRGGGGPERPIPWGAVRSFFKAAPPIVETDDIRPVTYFLDVGDGVLSWTLTEASAREALVETEILARLVVARAGLPLRDLAPMFARLDPARPGFMQRESAQEFVALRDSAGIESPRFGRSCALGCLAMLAMLVVFGGPFLALNRLQAYQSTYLAGLFPRIHAQAPLYHSTLAANDGAWPESPSAVPGTAMSYVFTDGAYHLSGQPGHFIQALNAETYGDAAVEVTGSQIGGDPRGVGDGVGLALRASGDTEMVIVTIHPLTQTWDATHYLYNPANPGDSWHVMDFGESGAIHRDGPNTLLVVMRGNAFVLYVNGSYVAAVTNHIDHAPLPRAGRAGVYLNDGAAQGVFTDFAVYPVTSPPSLEYV